MASHSGGSHAPHRPVERRMGRDAQGTLLRRQGGMLQSTKKAPPADPNRTTMKHKGKTRWAQALAFPRRMRPIAALGPCGCRGWPPGSAAPPNGRIRPITVIVHFRAPAGRNDLLGRLIAGRARAPRSEQGVVVENRPGRETAISA